MPLKAFTRLGPYEIQEPLGSGGMGEVYRARDKRLDRTVAVKVLRGDLEDRDAFRQRFEREARVVSSLNHPNICTLYDVGEQDGLDYLVMEYLEGETLERRLEKGLLAVDEAVLFAAQIADALSQAHERGVSHRDIKPSNIMLTTSGVKLLDFGIAKVRRGEDQADLTGEGLTLGTVPYMAPEQLEGQEVDGRTDIFALGGVMYEMLTGVRPFQGETQARLTASILTQAPRSVCELRPELSPAVDHVVRRCLAKNPNERWQTARDLMLELEWIGEAGLIARPVTEPAGRSSRTSFMGLAGWVAAALILGAFFFLWRSQPPPEFVQLNLALPPNAVPTTAVVSPDGRRIAYATREGSTTQLWIRSLDSTESGPLPGTKGAQRPSWSRDGRSLAFFAQGSLKKMTVFGGSPEVLSGDILGLGGSWTDQNDILFSRRMGGIHRISAAGGPHVSVTQLDEERGENAHRWPWMLPGNRRFVYFSRMGSSTAISVWSFDSQRGKLLTESDSQAVYSSPMEADSGHGRGRLLFVRDGVLVARPFDPERGEFVGEATAIAHGISGNKQMGSYAFSVSRNGVLVYHAGGPARQARIEWLDRTGSPVGKIAEREPYEHLRLSPNGRKAVAQVVDPYELWLVDLADGAKTLWAANSAYPVWSPDGTQIAYLKRRGNSFEVRIRPSDGSSAAEVLLRGPEPKILRDWSPQNHLLYEQMHPETHMDLWVAPIQGNSEPSAVLRSEHVEHWGRFSPDGKWIAYVSNETGASQVQVQPFPVTGASWIVSVDGGSRPSWRSDGRELYYISGRNELMAVDVVGRSGVFRAGKPRMLFATELERGYSGPAYAVSPDGQRFLFTRPQRQSGDVLLTVQLNWNLKIDAASDDGGRP